MLKFVDSGILYIVRMQNFVDQFGLCHDFRDVRHRCNSGNLLKQVAAGFAVFLSDEIGKLNAVYQRIEPQRLSTSSSGVMSGANSCPMSRVSS